MKLPVPHHLLTLTAVALAGVLVATPTLRAHESEQATKAFMAPYGKIQSALATDDLAGAQTAAKSLPQDKDAQAIAASKTLDDARAAFKHISQKAIGIAGGQEGYYIFKCSMVDDGYWVQTSTKVANPYLGQSMPGCGEVVTKDQAAKAVPGADGSK